jgi:hypothetical protein
VDAVPAAGVAVQVGEAAVPAAGEMVVLGVGIGGTRVDVRPYPDLPSSTPVRAFAPLLRG